VRKKECEVRAMDRHHHADSPNSGVVKKRKQEEDQVTKTLSFQFHDFLLLCFCLFNFHFSRILIVIVDHLNFMKFCVFFVLLTNWVVFYFCLILMICLSCSRVICWFMFGLEQNSCNVVIKKFLKFH